MYNIYINKNIGTMEKDGIKSKLYGTTTGCRSIKDFANGATWWTCGDGQDIKMTKEEIKYINSEICEGVNSELCETCKSECLHSKENNKKAVK